MLGAQIERVLENNGQNCLKSIHYLKLRYTGCATSRLRCSRENVQRRLVSSSAALMDFLDIPSPKGIPMIGTTFSLLLAGGPKKLHKYIDKRHKKLGPIFKDNVGPVTAVFLSDAEEIRGVFAKEGKYPSHIKPESWLVYNEKHGCSRGLFFMDGEEWLHYRRIMNKLLLKGDLSWIDRSCGVASNILLDTIKNHRNQIFPNLEKALYKWTMDVLVSVLIGSETFEKSHSQVEAYVELLASTVYLIFKTTVDFQLMPAKLAEKYQLRRWKNFDKAVGDALRVASDFLEYLNKNFKRNDGLLGRMRQEQVVDTAIDRIVIDLMLGAGDTTANTMAWALYLLSKNKEVQSEVRNNPADSSKSPVLRNVVRETLRLYPAAPFITRFPPEATTVCGYAIPANTLIVISLYTSGRDEKYFRNPDKFLPDRWIRNTAASNITSASIPFGMGARSCIGKKIAETQLQDALSKVVGEFDIELCNSGNIEDILEMITKPSEPLRLKFK